MISYASGIKGSSTAIWADDKIQSLKQLKYKFILLTNISSSCSDKIINYKTSSISKKDFKREKNICLINNNISLGIINSFIPYTLGVIFDKFLEFFTKGHGESRWSWTFTSFIYGFFICFKHKVDTIYTTGGAGSAHLTGIFLKIIFKKKKLIVEFQDPLIGEDIGRNINTSKYFSFFEKLIVKFADKVIYVTENSAKASYKRYKNNNIKFVYPGSKKFQFKETNISKKCKKLKLIHLGTLYSNRNLNNLIIAIENLIEKKIINNNDIQITNIGDIHCKERDYYLSKSFITQLPIMERKEALKNLTNCDLCLLIQHIDNRSKLTIPYKFYDYLNSNKLIFGITANNELNNLLESGGHYFSDSRDVKSIEETISVLLEKKKKNLLGKPLDLDININEQTKKIFDFN